MRTSAALEPDVILASGGSVVGALLEATRATPIVFTLTVDPVGAGFVASLARPDGNATGFTGYEYGLATKWLELLKEIAPRVIFGADTCLVQKIHSGRGNSVRASKKCSALRDAE
jgi:ABC-type uncharacterized transport system substrate-binding protein